MRANGYKCYQTKCGCCIGNVCAEPFDIALGCSSRLVKPQTNADRIRAMSDEELAKFLAAKCADIQTQNAFTKESPPTATQLSALAHSWYCAWMQWLKQPVLGGDNDG